jgi:hypothetical protein
MISSNDFIIGYYGEHKSFGFGDEQIAAHNQTGWDLSGVHAACFAKLLNWTLPEPRPCLNRNHVVEKMPPNGD